MAGVTKTGKIPKKLPRSVAEVAMIRSLQSCGVVPYLTRWQYSLLGIRELRDDDSISNSTVFSHIDSMSISGSCIILSPVKVRMVVISI